MSDDNFVVGNNKCKKPAYTKNEIDQMVMTMVDVSIDIATNNFDTTVKLPQHLQNVDINSIYVGTVCVSSMRNGEAVSGNNVSNNIGFYTVLFHDDKDGFTKIRIRGTGYYYGPVRIMVPIRVVKWI